MRGPFEHGGSLCLPQSDEAHASAALTRIWLASQVGRLRPLFPAVFVHSVCPPPCSCCVCLLCVIQNGGRKGGRGCGCRGR